MDASRVGPGGSDEEAGGARQSDGVLAGAARGMPGPVRSAVIGRWMAGAAAALIVLVYPWPFQASGVTYFQTVGFLVFLYAMLGVAWNIVGGWCGQFDFGPMVFFGLGAYTVASGLKFFALNPWLGFAAAAVLAALFCAAVTYPITRLQRHYFAIATNAIWLIALPVASNWSLIGGSQGMFIPLHTPGTLAGALLNLQPGGGIKEIVFYYVALFFCLLTLWFAVWVDRSKFGYYFKAIRDDREGAESLGINSRSYRVLARCCTAAVFGVGGGIYAIWALAVFPEQVLDFSWGVLPTVAVALGGIGRLFGPVLGCVILVPLSQVMSTYLGTGPLAGRGIDLLVYGAIIMVISAARPQGLFSLPWQDWWRRLRGTLP